MSPAPRTDDTGRTALPAARARIAGPSAKAGRLRARQILAAAARQLMIGRNRPRPGRDLAAGTTPRCRAAAGRTADALAAFPVIVSPAAAMAEAGSETNRAAVPQVIVLAAGAFAPLVTLTLPSPQSQSGKPVRTPHTSILARTGVAVSSCQPAQRLHPA